MFADTENGRSVHWTSRTSDCILLEFGIYDLRGQDPGKMSSTARPRALTADILCTLAIDTSNCHNKLPQCHPALIARVDAA